MNEEEYTWTNAMFQKTVSHWRARAEAAEAELNVTRDLLRAVPETSAAWYADICDYLETL